MSLRRASATLNENAEDCLTPGRNSAWNTNAALLSIANGLFEEFAAIHQRFDQIEARLHAIESSLHRALTKS